MNRYNPDQFFRWLSEPMKPEEIHTWNMMNNIIPELTELFKDFCFSFYYLMRDTYLGDADNENKITKIGMTVIDKHNHFKWCWDKTIDNFKKENISFKFSDIDYGYFEEFFFEVFYNIDDKILRDSLDGFIKQLFNRKRPTTKSDLEMFTDVYKILERSLLI